MKKFAVVLGVAAVATLTGCRDQDYDAKRGKSVQEEPKSIETVPAQQPVEVVVVEPTCNCPPGTKHAAPCACGARDCKCVVEKPQPVAPPPAPAPECTTYVVQNGDYLAKISKKYNVTISSIKRLNNLKDDKIRVGQKLKLPGKIDVGVQAAPVTAAPAKGSVARKPAARKGYVPYSGATKEYVVKNGDTLGSVAYGNGISIRQLKELNKLAGDSLKVGQKLKIPAEKVAEQKKPVAAGQTAVETKKAAEVEVKAAAAEVKAADAEVKAAEAELKAVEAELKKAETEAKEVATEPIPVPPATTTYVVMEGDDLTRLAVEYGVTPTVIRELNNLGENEEIKPGQVLKLPAESQQ